MIIKVFNDLRNELQQYVTKVNNKRTDPEAQFPPDIPPLLAHSLAV